MLMVMGPHAGLGNFPRAAEYSVDWVTGLIRYARDRGVTRIEATAAGVARVDRPRHGDWARGCCSTRSTRG